MMFVDWAVSQSAQQTDSQAGSEQCVCVCVCVGVRRYFTFNVGCSVQRLTDRSV